MDKDTFTKRCQAIGLSCLAVSRFAGISESTYRKWEKFKPLPETQARVEHVLRDLEKIWKKYANRNT
jgi:hypothetical protein